MQFKTVLAPLAAALALAWSHSAMADEVVRIGHVGPLSGAIAHMGKDNENGAKMAIEELNAKGVTINGQKVRFELLSEDDAADPKQATAAAQKLVDSHVNAVVGHLNSGTTIPASKIYYDAGIPQISPASTNPKYTLQGFNTTFRVVANDAQLGGALGKYAATTLAAKTVAVVDDRTAYGQGVAEEFTKAARKAGIKIVSQQFTNDKATDFNAILTAIKAKKPDLIFFGGMDAVGGPMLLQMKRLGINTRFMGGDGICTTDLPKLANGGLADDQVYCAEAGGVPDSGKQALDAFKVAYQKKFGTDVKIYSPYVYDAVMTFAQAMVEAKSADPKKYLPFLAKIHHQGVTGPISFDAHGDVKDGSLSVYTYKGGQRTLVTVTK